MARFIGITVLIGVIAGAVQGQAPAPTGAVSSASFALAALPNGPVAEGSIFALFGANMGPATLVQNTSLTLPTTAGLAGTVVTVTVNGVTAAAPMVFTSSGVVAGIMPSNIPVGTGTMTVTYNGASGSTPITVVAGNFSMYTSNGSGSGPATVVDGANNTVVTATNSAAPGDEVVLYGTGLGPLPAGQNDASNPPVQTNLTTPIAVYVGTTQVNVLYHGRSGDAGLDQINFKIPPGVSGCGVPIIVQSGSGSTLVTGNSGTISVAATTGAACSDPSGVPLSSITLNGGGTLNLGNIVLLQTTTTVSGKGSQTSSIGSATFSQYSPLQVAQAGFAALPSIGSCVVSQFSGSSPSSAAVTGTGLNAGNSISLTGPATNLILSVVSTGVYSGVLQTAFPAGSFTVSGPGGTSVGPFSTTLLLPPAINWTNASSTINRGVALQVNWTGGSSGGFVLIEGGSSNSPAGGALFLCIAPNTGSFTVPVPVLLSLPPSVFAAGIPTGFFTLGSYTAPQTFTATGLNYGIATTANLSSGAVLFQ